MKIFLRLMISVLLVAAWSQSVYSQASPVAGIIPKGTHVFGNVAYAADTSSKHLLDIYLPEKMKPGAPLIVWVHGGAWMMNDKYADMSYMRHTVRSFLDSGYAFASIDYRFSTQAIFPAQIQDCNLAIEYLYQHAATYRFDRNNIALIGFSAGGHLVSLLALSANNPVAEFYPAGMTAHFNIKCVLDFYGPSDLVALGNNPDTAINNERNPVAILLGALTADRPDLARKASPVTYVDKNDPPFLIVQGEKDESVPNTQSRMLHSWLTLAGVTSKLIMVPGAPHYGAMFDAEDIRKEVFSFLNRQLNKKS